MKTICLDFDGVLYPNWRYFSTSDLRGEPLPGALEFVKKLQERYIVVVHSSRCADPEGLRAVDAYLKNKGFDVQVFARKPRAAVYLDDRAVCFTGDYGAAFEQIVGFKQWQADEKARNRIARKRFRRRS